MTQSSSLTLHNIQVLRAVAAIMVVMHHAFPHYEAMGGTLSWIQHMSTWGFMGVDIFFVISGFIMAYTTFNKPRNISSAKTFLKHRLYRIYLGYWPFFFVMLAALYISNPQKLSNLDVLGSFLLTNNDMFQLVLPISWSLSYELYFYILFIFTFLFSAKQLHTWMPVFVGFILFLVLYAYFSPEFPQSFFYSHFLLEFFAGVLLYMYRRYLTKTWVLPVSIIIIIIAYGYGINYETKNGLFRVLTFGVGALFMVLSALILEQKSLYPKLTLFKDLGDASYTLYLSHLIILQLFYFSGLRALFNSQNTLLPLLGFFTILLLSIVFSLLYYKIVERPIYSKAVHLGK